MNCVENISQFKQLIKEWELTPEDQRGNLAGVEPIKCFQEVVSKQLKREGFCRFQLLEKAEAHSLSSLTQLLTYISEEFGYLLPQTSSNNVIALIQDENKNYNSHVTRGHQTNNELKFHSDRCDLVMLLYIRPASIGGALSVVSYSQALNVLGRENPELHDTLFTNFPFDLRNEGIFKSLQWYSRPICWNSEDGVRGHYIRRFIEDSRRSPDCEDISLKQKQALDAFDQVLERLGRINKFSPKGGELLILDNYQVLHSRSKFENSREKGSRLALRTWIAPYSSVQLPQFILPMTGSVLAGSFRGGVGSGQEYIMKLGLKQKT